MPFELWVLPREAMFGTMAALVVSTCIVLVTSGLPIADSPELGVFQARVL